MSASPTSITELRLNKGLSQTKAAKAAGVKLSVWNRAENGRRVSPANARRIASFFDRRVTDIWPLEPAPASEVA